MNSALDRITVLSNSSKYSLAVPLSLLHQHHSSVLISYPLSLGRLSSAAYDRLPAPAFLKDSLDQVTHRSGSLRRTQSKRRSIAPWRSHVMESQARSGPEAEQIEHFSPFVYGILRGRMAITTVLREVPLPLSSRQCQILL